jgi:serine/threonine protein kinase
MSTNQELIAGRYKANRLIGKGGMGKVFLGEHIELGQEVAIKCLRSHSKENENSVRRFCLEASTYASINHPNLVKLHEFERTTRGDLRMILEYVRGETLGVILHKYKALHPLFAIDVTTQIAQGLAAAHEKNIVHRDLKPDNIMLSPLTKDRRHYHVKLLDFGIAKQLYREQDNNLTAMGMVCGTPDYMSPEQACGHPVAKQSDIYSLGVVFFEMLTGRLPYIGDNKRHVMQAHCSNPIPFIAKYSPYKIPQALEDIMQRCLAKNAQDRYQSLDDLIQALDHLVLAEYDQRTLGSLLSLPVEKDQKDQKVKQAARVADSSELASKGKDVLIDQKDPNWDLKIDDRNDHVKHYTSGVQLMSARRWIQNMIIEVQEAFKYNQNNRHIMGVGATFLCCLAIALTLKIQPDLDRTTQPTPFPNYPDSS